MRKGQWGQGKKQKQGREEVIGSEGWQLYAGVGGLGELDRARVSGQEKGGGVESSQL